MTSFILQTLLTITALLVMNSSIAQGVYLVSEDIEISSEAEFLGAFDNRLIYFNKSGSSNKLWLSDATADGTYSLSGEEQSQISLLGQTANEWYFIETLTSGYQVSKLSLGSDVLEPVYFYEDRIRRGVLWQEQLYLIQESGTPFDADALVKFDPNTGDTEILFTSGFGGLPGVAATDNELFFIASTDEGKMLGKSDGSQANTATFFKLFDAGGEFSAGSVFMQTDGHKMYFFYSPSSSQPYNLWVSEGTANSTIALREHRRPSGPTQGQFAFLNGKFYYIMAEPGVPSGTTLDLFVTDGTVDGTINLKGDEFSYLHPRNLTIYNNKIYFNSLTLNWALRATNGTVAGTETIITPYGYQSGGIGGIAELGTYNGQLVIQAFNYTEGAELYLSDGSLEGTNLLADVMPGAEDSYPREMTQVGDLLYFSAITGNSRRLWVYNPNLVSQVVDYDILSKYRVYPNPIQSNNPVQIELELYEPANQASIVVYDVLGRVVYQEVWQPRTSVINFNMPTNPLSEGQYFVAVIADGRRVLTTTISKQ